MKKLKDQTIRPRTIHASLLTLLATATALAAPERYFGEPVALKGRAMYFTSWKYVRQGSFTWRVQVDPNASEAERQAVGAWMKGDGNRPAVFESFDMPRGIRLVALQANGEGEFATVYVVPPGERLRVNADVAPSGWLNVAIRTWGSREDLPGRTFAESDRIIGNSLSHRVTWKGEDRIGHQGRPVMLRVQMKQAKLFAFGFE